MYYAYGLTEQKTRVEQNSVTSQIAPMDIVFSIQNPTPPTEAELKENKEFLEEIAYQCSHHKLALILRDLCPADEAEPLQIVSAINQTANKLKLAGKDSISARDVMVNKNWPMPEVQSTTSSSSAPKPYPYC